ncbi:PIN domain-containing protein [Thomasclavelia ramosa]|uniref:PIN domain-containing protein n=1 Tax=Thomasclavelia ramosa TaxID=1547 RepID=UPI003DA3C523
MINYPLNVTIDTNIFEENKFDFGPDGTMNLLIKNVQNGKIKLVLSNIVIKEVEKHICKCVDDVCGKARKLRKEYLSILPEQYLSNIGMEMYIQLPDKETVHRSAKDIFFKFLEDCNVERLDTSGINLEKILEDYFSIRPPFENSEKKRKEFPDAFIAEEIRNRFGNDEIVAIVSKDNGLINACSNSKNHLFFSSLGELFNTLYENDKEYAAMINLIKNNNDSIIQNIRTKIDESCIEVRGLSYDKDGIVDGYDYDEIYLEHCYLSGVKIHTIEDIDENIVTASLWIYGNISVNCYFQDFEKAYWDSEEKEYPFVETRHMLEKHSTRFACRIEVNRKTSEIRVLPFKIILGGDSRKSRIEIDDEQENLYQELEDTDREELGFCSLSKYGDMLEDCLNESNMAKEMIQLFEQYNNISSCYEDLAILYDDIYEQINIEEEELFKEFVLALSSQKKCISIDFSEEDINKLFDETRGWLDSRLEVITEKMDRRLPDCIEYGESISILGANCEIYTLTLGELQGIPEAGSEEQIEISISLNEEIVAKGYVTLTVGYLNFDEDGGAADGLEDNIDYEVYDILNVLKDLISELKEELDNEQELANFVENCLRQKHEELI